MSLAPHAVSPDLLYDFEQLNVDDRLLDQVFAQVHQLKTVTPLLQNVLADMLNCDELTRPAPSQLLAVLAPHRDTLVAGSVDFELVAPLHQFNAYLRFRDRLAREPFEQQQPPAPKH